ncbi:hypothetical protein RXV86_09025 [Alisedimentitalea sp. MJ-SS2]|uniref:hypothetical protein n=1 Tax=Aliisedimentitalea sp. MJ-SS2 TaxID=3049795 RepID=UPI002906443A|nr:hypothetical protein [Alisedimentitalea sp. MJ-SS2]MDU8927524.1 hypothetical protein [Alisedimentitalea sp. MJ-SS2]
MKLTIHIATAALAMLLIATFWVSTLATELFASHQTVASVKWLIVYGMGLLIPSIATAGATGNSLGRGWRLPAVARKKRRMGFIAANGLLILLPSAVFLAFRAGAGQFDTLFYTVQALELIAGATNFTLMALNMRDGRAISRRKRTRPSTPKPQVA